MSPSDSTSGTPKEPDASEPKRFKLRPSRNQKQRSRLKQVFEAGEPVAQMPPPPAPTTPPPPPPPPDDESLLRRMRLKRSGQMHEDMLTQAEPPPSTEDQY